MKKKLLALFLVSLLVLTMAGCGAAEKFPTKPVTVIVPWAAGGGTDAVARGLAKATEKALGQTITVNNVTGGGGAVGHGAGLNAKNDGYTVTMITFELLSLPPQKLVPFTYKDFDLLMRVNMDSAALTVKADAPYQTLKDFIEYAKANPGKINVGNSGPGSVWHIAAGLLEEKTGIKLNHVPFNGAAPAITDLVGGHIQAVTVSPAEVQSQVKAGQLKMLAVMSPERNPNFPDVPTFKELGYDINFGTWRGLAVPKGTPDNVKKVLADAFKKGYDSQEFQDFAKKAGLGLAYAPADKFKEFLDSLSKDVESVMQKLGLVK
ncbi:MAG: transporter substrate-binding protein [Peptococcaceae bacterium]|nr:transporter substrate-binding protein [Peptococcaceae bacterium]